LPTDIYAMGSVHAASGVPSAATPADLHYDGSSWTRLPLSGRDVGQTVEPLSATDGWASQWERGSDAASGDHIARADHLSGAAALPTNDLNFSTAITPMPDGSYWAIGGYEVAATSEQDIAPRSSCATPMASGASTATAKRIEPNRGAPRRTEAHQGALTFSLCSSQTFLILGRGWLTAG
jgi:hypothetical protein